MLGGTRSFSSFSADDLDAEKRFFGETLGLDTTEEHGMLMVHLAGDREVAVYPKPDHQPASFTVLNFQVDDLEQEVDELAAKGVTFERYDQDDRGIVSDPEMGRIAWFTDPAGNVLSVVEDAARS